MGVAKTNLKILREILVKKISLSTYNTNANSSIKCVKLELSKVQVIYVYGILNLKSLLQKQIKKFLTVTWICFMLSVKQTTHNVLRNMLLLIKLKGQRKKYKFILYLFYTIFIIHLITLNRWMSYYTCKVGFSWMVSTYLKALFRWSHLTELSAVTTMEKWKLSLLTRKTYGNL